MTSDPPAERLEGLQALRGIAALLVVLYHANRIYIPALYGEGTYAWAGYAMGYAGVEVFFVLSGYIIMRVHRVSIGQPNDARRYVYRRMTRILPPYWAALMLCIAVFWLARTPPPEAVGTGLILANFLMVVSLDVSLIDVVWTLQYEMIFYAVFLGMILHRWAGAALFAAWMGLILYHAIGGSVPSVLSFLAAPYPLLFLLGMAAAQTEKLMPERLALPGVLLGSGLFVCVGLAEALFAVNFGLGPRTLLYGIATAVGIMGLVGLERAGRLRVPGILLKLGDASYATYLIHMLALMVVVKIMRDVLPLHMYLPPFALIWVLGIAGCAAGFIFFHVFERPILASMRRKADARRK